MVHKMQKKKFDLTAEIVNIDDDGAERDISISEAKIKPPEEKKVLITMSVEESVRKEYKIWCARNGMQMKDAFIKGFELLKKLESK